MNERDVELSLHKEIPFDPDIIARVLGARAERPSVKMVNEAKELGIDLTEENIWEIFLFDGLRKVEQSLILYSDKKEVVLHTRIQSEVQPVIGKTLGKIEGKPIINVSVDENQPATIKDLNLGYLRLNNVNKVTVFPSHVLFESPNAKLDIYPDCQHNFVTKSGE